MVTSKTDRDGQVKILVRKLMAYLNLVSADNIQHIKIINVPRLIL